MGRGALGVGLLAAGGVAAAAWFFLLGGGGSPGGEPGGADDPAAGDAAADAAPSLAGGRARTATPAARTADFRATGKVVDDAGKSIGGLRVTARRTGPVWDQGDPSSWGDSPVVGFKKGLERYDAPKVEEEKPHVEGEAAADGAFDLALPEAGTYELKAWPAAPLVGFPGSVAVTVAKPAGKATLVVGTGGALRVRVLDAKENGLVGFVDGWWQMDDRQRWWTLPRRRTDAATGDASWDAVPAGTGTISVLVPGRGQYGGIEVKTPRADVLVIRLVGLGILKGRVTDAEGKPVAGADLTVTSGKGTSESGFTTGNVRAKSEADGTWRAEGAWPGKVTQAAAYAEGFTLLSQSPPRAPWSGAEVAEGRETTIDLVLSRGASVAGRVTETGTGAGVEGVELTLVKATSGGEWSGYPPKATTDAEGRYRFDEVPLGKHVIFPKSRTHYFAPLEAARGPTVWTGGAQPGAPPSVFVVLSKEGETQERDLTMSRGLSIRGRTVGPDGAPVAGADVSDVGGEMYNVAWKWGVQWNGGAGSALATSGDDGTFTASGLSPRADWVLTASKGTLYGVPSDPIALAEGSPAPTVTLKMETGATLEGRVVDGEGKGLFGATLWYWNNTGNGSASATTEADGAFLLEGLGAGPGQVQANHGQRTVSKAIDPPLAAGEQRRGLELKIEAGLEVSGVVVDEQGKPVSGLHLNAQTSGGGWSNSSDSTNADGSFVLVGLSAGKVTLQVNEQTEAGYSRQQALGEPLTVPSSGNRVVYKAKKTTTLVVRVTDADGRPVPLCSVKIGGGPPQAHYAYGHDADETVNGEARRDVEGNPPWKVTASAPRDARGLPLNLKAKSGEITDPAVPLTLALEPGTEIAGIVVGPDGKGLEGIPVTGAGVSTTSDPQGVWRLRGLSSSDAVDVQANPPSKWQKPPAVKARPGEGEVRLVLSPSAGVGGYVFGPDGKPFQQCSVSGQWRSPANTNGHVHANPDASGRFRLEGFPADALVTLTVQAYSMEGAQSLRGVRLKDVPAGKEDLVVRLVEGVRIEGRALQADGTKPGNAWIQATRVDGAEDAVGGGAMWKEDGTFVISGLAPGPHNVVVNGQTGALSEPRRVDAPAKGIEITLPARAKLVGRLEGEGDLKGFSVTAWPATPAAPGQPGPQPLPTPVDSAGNFSFDLPADAEIWLSASKREEDRYALLGPMRVGSVAGTTTLRLVTGTSLSGVIEDAAGNPVASGHVLAQASHFRVGARTDAQGRFRVRGLPPGRYQISVYVTSGPAAGSGYQPLGEHEAGAADLRLKTSK